MNRYIVIKDNKIISERFYTEAVEGEILDNGTYGNLGDVLINGTWQKDPSEIQLIQKRTRILELKEIIDNKNYLGDDVTAERAELRELLGL